MLPTDVSRCCGVSGETTGARTCPERDDCERHRQFTLHGPGAEPAPLWLCASPDFEARIPRPCAGKTTRHTSRPHPICRGATGIAPCTRWCYGITDGITPDFSDNGAVTCADKPTVAE